MKRFHNRLKRDSVTVAGAFLLSLLAFSAVLLLPTVIPRLLSPAEEAGEAVAGSRGTERTAWIVLHDDNRLVALVRVVADTRTMTVRTVGYPPQTEITDGTAVTTAAAVFATLREEVASRIVLDETVLLSVNAAAGLMSEWAGNVPLVLSQEVYGLPSGALTVTPLQAAQLLRFENWEQGMVGQANIAAELVAAVLDRALTDTADMEAMFGALASVSDTRLHISQYAAVCDDLQKLALQRTEPFCSASVAAGYTVGVGDAARYIVTKR